MSSQRSWSLFSANTHNWIYFVLFCILVASMPTSRFMMSFSQLLMGANWLLAGNYKENFNRFSTNKPALTFFSLFSIYVIALLWTQDLVYALGKDLVDKLPMLTLTFLVASSKPLSRLQVHILAYIFFASVLVTSFIGLHVYLTGNYTNFRHISPYISHVYLSMMVCMTIAMLPWLTHRLSKNIKWLALVWIVILWLVVFLFILRSFTGIICFGAMILFMIIRAAFYHKRLWVRFSLVLLLVALFAVPGYYMVTMYRKISLTIETPPEKFDRKTALGNTYSHDLENPLRENGHFVYRFISNNELREAWNQRSELDFDGQDMLKNRLRHTVLRFLSSRGLLKDKEAVEQLSDEEIKAIERGIPNYLYLEWPGFKTRLHQTIWEVYWYQEQGDPSGFSFAQRIELWRAAWKAFLEKPLLGWGTGDIFTAMYHGLETIDSPMENYHFKPHNQYLLFLITFGILGTLSFFAIFIRFVMITHSWKQLPFNLFLVIMLVSMLANNPIDAQAGQTFFTFFTLWFGILHTWKPYFTDNNMGP